MSFKSKVFLPIHHVTSHIYLGMIELSQWRACIGGFYPRQKMKSESPVRWKQSLSKAQPEPVPEYGKTPSSMKTKPPSSTEAKKVTPIEDTATPTIHKNVGNTCCVTLLVGLHSRYIL